MKALVVRGKDAEEKDYGNTKVTDLLNGSDCPFSVALVKHIGAGKLGFDPESSVAYYVLTGKGGITIEGKEHELANGDLVFLPAGTKYKKTKGLTLLAISYPRFDRKKRIYFEK